jgi:uroporphyrinogen decarboxylase
MKAKMNHWQRIEAAMRGDPVDRTPISLWRHWPDYDQDPRALAEVMVRWQRDWDFDLVKFMPTGTYSIEDWGAQTVYKPTPNGTRTITKPAVADAAQWPKLERLDVTRGYFAQQTEALGAAARALQDSVPILQTVFSPLTTARKLAGEGIFEDMRSQPGLFEAGLEIITEATCEFARQSLQAGAHGLFLASQCSSLDVMTEDEYRRFGMKHDLQVLAAVRPAARFNMLHVHGTNTMFDLMASYPVEMLNWHDRRAQPSLREAKTRYGGLLVGGIDELATLLDGPAQRIEAELADAVAQTGGRRLLLGPGCVCPIATPQTHLRAAVEFLAQQ